MILVLGGGFGLYGHVAALASSAMPVTTLDRYREQAHARPELLPLLDRVTWIEGEHIGLQKARTTVLARLPAQNAALAARLIHDGVGGDLLVEKPLAPTPDAADALAGKLAASGRRWAVPYLFAHTDWGRAVLDALSSGRAARIEWAHHPTPSKWKGDPAAGGGALAFYLIHALALIAEGLPNARVTGSRESDGALTLLADDQFRLRFEFAAKPSFAVDWETSGLRAAGPFGHTPKRGLPDPRIAPLQAFHKALGQDRWPALSFHTAIHRHWRALSDLL